MSANITMPSKNVSAKRPISKTVPKPISGNSLVAAAENAKLTIPPMDKSRVIPDATKPKVTRFELSSNNWTSVSSTNATAVVMVVKCLKYSKHSFAASPLFSYLRLSATIRARRRTCTATSGAV